MNPRVDTPNALAVSGRSGEYPPDSRLPSRNELMSRYHVALATVNNAIGELRGGAHDYHSASRGARSDVTVCHAHTQ